MSDTPARFSPISANPLPDCVQVGGTIYCVGPLNSPSGNGWLPADLLAGYNLAQAHINIAIRLLEMAKGLQPHEYKFLVHETRTEPNGSGRWASIPNEMANLAYELLCQNGAEVITALFEQLSKANTTGGPIRVGSVEEPNAHAAAYAATRQLAREVLQGKPLSIASAELERLGQLVCSEARSIADQRRGAQAVKDPTRTHEASATFHLLAFRLLGIDGLPLPSGDGFDGDPYLTERHYQELCNIVCELVPGMTAKDWWEASEGRRIACLETALRKGAAQPEDGHRVVLRGPGDRPIVDRVEKAQLTLPQHDVVTALLAAGERGLSKDELDRKSKHGDARKILKRLAESDPDWKAVISFPGKPGGGYRIG